MFEVERGTVWASQFFVGLDLGQVNDPSAIAVVERVEMVGEWDAVAFAPRREIELRLRRLERLPLGMRYPEVEEQALLAVEGVARLGTCLLVADATGVGRPVVDHLRASISMTGDGGKMRAVMVTSGQSERFDGEYDYVPKKDLMVGLQVLFEYEELKIPRSLGHLEVLKKELADMRVKVTPAGNEQFGAWREGDHDDLVFAVALGCWGAKKSYPGKLAGWDGHWVGRDFWRRRALMAR